MSNPDFKNTYVTLDITEKDHIW